MSVPSWFSRKEKSCAARRKSRIPSRRLLTEVLEQRRLLATLTVNSELDNVTAADGLVTLREAIIAANGDLATDLGDVGSGPDTIVFDPSLDGTPIVLSITGTEEDTAIDGDLDITTEVTIQGRGESNTIIDGGGSTGTMERVLHVAIGGNLMIDNLTVTGGTTTGFLGGAGVSIDEGATATVTNSTLSGNSADGVGGGLSNYGTANLTSSTLSGNSASLSGGGLYNYGTVTLNGSTLSGNSAASLGGGLYNNGTTTLNGSILSGNSGSGGGGFYNAGTATISDSTISGNSASNRGGGLYNNDKATITGSTISGNSSGSDGGGLLSAGTTTLTNSTLSGNSATGNGGGVFNEFDALTIVNSTITGNISDSDGDAAGTGGGLWTYNDPATFSTLLNTIVAGNLVGTGTAPSDISNKTVEAGSLNNLVGDPASAGGLIEGTGGNLVGNGSGMLLPINDILGVLTGGPTETHALVPGSRAIDAGSNANATVDGTVGGTALMTDQRGGAFSRIVNSTVDIGSFEFEPVATSLAIAATDAAKVEGNSGLTPFTFTVTRTGTGATTVDFAVTAAATSPAAATDFEGGAFAMGQVSFTATDGATKMITVNVNGDTDVESDEGFVVTLSSPTGGATITTAAANGTIQNDDAASGNPVLVVSPAGPNGAPDSAPLPGTSGTPTTWAMQRSSIRQFVVTLPSPVSAVTASDLVLTNLGVQDADPDQVITLQDSQLTLDGTNLTISFPAFDPSSPDNGALSDGRYKLDLLPALTGGATFTIVGDGPANGTTNGLFVLAGDWNGSGAVTALDFTTFTYWFGQEVNTGGMAPEYVDTNNSGAVTALDFTPFLNNFGTSVEFPTTGRSKFTGESEFVPATQSASLAPDASSEEANAVADASLLGILNESLATGAVDLDALQAVLPEASEVATEWDSDQDGRLTPEQFRLTPGELLQPVNRLILKSFVPPALSAPTREAIDALLRNADSLSEVNDGEPAGRSLGELMTLLAGQLAE